MIDDYKETFSEIFKKNKWKNSESRSGYGSTLKYTENLRTCLPLLYKKYNIKSLIDAPCGDFNWMKHVVLDTQNFYIGGDIVDDIINQNKKYETQRVKFINFDIIKTPFPKVDLWLCRHCLIHLSENDIFKSLENFINSDIQYLLTTSHKNNKGFVNKDIITGGFRLLDLFSAPYNFSSNPLERIDDWLPPDPENEMLLFSKEQVIEVVERNLKK